MNIGRFTSPTPYKGDPAVSEFLIKHQWTITQLARALGVSRRAVARWAHCKRLNSMQKLALRGLDSGLPWDHDYVKRLEELTRCLVRMNQYLEHELNAFRSKDVESTAFSSLNLAGQPDRPFYLEQ